MLAQCPALVHLDLKSNDISNEGAATLAGVLGRCSALTHLNLESNPTSRYRAQGLASVLAQCTGQRSLQEELDSVQRWLTSISPTLTYEKPAGAASLAPVLGQCAALTHLNLNGNYIQAPGVGRLAGVLGQF